MGKVPYLREVSTFNINHDVRIRITGHGLQYLRDTGQTWKLTPGYSTGPVGDGTYIWQVWDIAATFGPILGNGLRLPIETEIELIPDEYRRRLDLSNDRDKVSG